jgi:hypothetical protein
VILHLLDSNHGNSRAAAVSAPESRQLPNFIAVGPTRTGTTWLYQFLIGRVGLPANMKETRFFDRDYDQGMEVYVSRFVNCPRGRPIGETSPTYFNSRVARERIALHVPDCKIICTLRDPVERLHSSYRLSLWYGITVRSFERYLEERRDAILDESDYARHIEAWQETFGKDHVLVMLYDDFLASTQTYVDQLCDFIGIQRITVSDARVETDDRVFAMQRVPRAVALGSAKLHRSFETWLHRHLINGWLAPGKSSSRIWKTIAKIAYKDMPTMKQDTEVRLRSALRSRVEALEALIDRDLSGWKQQKSTADKDHERTMRRRMIRLY